MHAIVVPRRRSNPPPFLLAIAAARLQGETITVEAEQLVVELFQAEGRSLDRAPAYLRSIVLNLARDHNRRGLVSLRHHATAGREVDVGDDTADQLVRSEESDRVLQAVRRLPGRQRDCITLRYFEEYPIDRIAITLGVSVNSVKTHLQRGMAALDRSLSDS